MKPITRYEAIDGHTFKTAEECEKYERLLAELKRINAMLRRAVDEGCNFANGYGFVQQTPEALKRFDEAFAEFLAGYISQETANLYSKCPQGIVGRYLSDGGGAFYDAAYRLWVRRYSIDEENREWGQPFYAMPQNKGRRELTPWLNVIEATS